MTDTLLIGTPYPFHFDTGSGDVESIIELLLFEILEGNNIHFILMNESSSCGKIRSV